MRQVNPAMPPHTAVTARPRTGSSSFKASSAPTTAPKNEAAHARKGVSSHPKMRKRRRTQRIGLGATLPHRSKDGGEDQPREERHGNGGQAPACSGETDHDCNGSKQYGRSECEGKADQRRRAAGTYRLIRQDPGTHPGKEGAHHPPHRMVPPVAAAADSVPAVGVGADILKHTYIHEKEDGSRGEADTRSTGYAFNGSRPGP